MAIQEKKKTWTSDELREKLSAKNDNGYPEYPRWVMRAVVAIWELQTADEKRTKTTKHHNNVGFSAAHDTFLSSLAEQMVSAKKRTGKYSLSPNQMKYAQKYIPSYARQLAEIANGKLSS